MSDGDKLGISAHLHLLMRRKLGRITDVEWMSTNREYATAMVKLAFASPHPELHDWAAKLDAMLPSYPEPQPLPKLMPDLVVGQEAEPAAAAAATVPAPERQYVGRLR